jgi:hypothetical protein
MIRQEQQNKKCKRENEISSRSARKLKIRKEGKEQKKPNKTGERK